MYARLKEIYRRPEIFSVHTAKTLWTDPHLASQMLQLHLSQDTDLASRPIEAIDRFVDWIDREFGLAGKAVCDLGCGPGLYARRYAARGAVVHGMDFSRPSINHARERQPANAVPVTYRVADYLETEPPPEQDLITLIYCDLCALSPSRRQALLRNIHRSLAPDGRFVFDVFSTRAFETVREGVSLGRNYMNGFWSARDYFAFHGTFRYDEEAVSLDRYTVIEEARRWDVYNWLRYFSRDGIRDELARAGFDRVQITDGFGVDRSDPSTFGVIARP